MKQFSRFLFPESIHLSLSAIDQEAALEEMISSLRHDPRISNWEEFSRAIIGGSRASIPIDDHRSMVIHHVRTNAVQDLVITAGCSQQGIYYDKGRCLVFLIFVITIPYALNNEYLRVMGVIARLCQELTFFNTLIASPTPKDFIELLP